MTDVWLRLIEDYMQDQEVNLRQLGLTEEQVQRAMDPIRSWYDRTKEQSSPPGA